MKLKKGQIVWCLLDDSIEREQQGKRPCVVVQNDLGNRFAPTTIIVPLTSSKSKGNLPIHVKISSEDFGGILKDSTALCEQIRVVDKKRIIYTTQTYLSNTVMKKIEESLKISFGVGSEQKREMVLVSITEGIGSEQRSSKPIPAVIMQNDVGNQFSPTLIIAPITTAKKGKKSLPTQVHFERQGQEEFFSTLESTQNFHDFTVLMEQIRVVDKSRVTYTDSQMKDDIKQSLEKALLVSLGIENK